MSGSENSEGSASISASISSIGSEDPPAPAIPQNPGGYVDFGHVIPGHEANVRHPQASDALVTTELPTGTLRPTAVRHSFFCTDALFLMYLFLLHYSTRRTTANYRFHALSAQHGWHSCAHQGGGCWQAFCVPSFWAWWWFLFASSWI